VTDGLLSRFCCSGTDASAKTFAVYADPRTPSVEPHRLACGFSQFSVFVKKVDSGCIACGRKEMSVRCLLFLKIKTRGHKILWFCCNYKELMISMKVSFAPVVNKW